MLGDLRATLQQTHAPAARWAAMMAWLKRWWPTLGPSAQEEAVAYLAGHADRLPSAVRHAPAWAAHALLRAPASLFGTLFRYLPYSQHDMVPGLEAVLASWPRIQVVLAPGRWCPMWLRLDPARIASFSYNADEVSLSVEAQEWLSNLSALERLHVHINLAEDERWVVSALRASANTLAEVALNLHELVPALERVAQMPALSRLTFGPPLRWRDHDQREIADRAALPDILRKLAWPEPLRAVHVTQAALFAHVMDALYTPELGAQLTECGVVGALSPEAFRRLWGNLPNADMLRMDEHMSEAHVEAIVPRLASLRTLDVAGPSVVALTRRLVQLERSALEHLRLVELDSGSLRAVERWLSRRPPTLVSLSLRGSEDHDINALTEGVRRGAFQHLEWCDLAGDALLSMRRVGSGLPRVRELHLPHAEARPLYERACSLDISGVEQARLGGPTVTQGLEEMHTMSVRFDWLVGAPLVSLDCRCLVLAPDAFDVLGRDVELRATLEHIDLWIVHLKALNPAALCELVRTAPWLSFLSIVMVDVLPAELAAALVAAPSLENLKLSINARFAEALRDALRMRGQALCLRQVDLYEGGEEAGEPPSPELMREVFGLLRACAPGVKLRYNEEDVL